MKYANYKRRKRRCSWLWAIPAAILLAALLYVSGILYPSGRGGSPVTDPALTDWMASLGDERPLSLINIPGTHDSGTRFIFPDYFLQDQDTDAARQLLSGYRYLDVRVALSKDGNGLDIVHAFGACRKGAALWSGRLTFDDLAADTLAFLDAHPGETVIFCVKPERGSDDEGLIRGLIAEKMAEAPDRWFAENRIPTLGEVRGRIVLCRRYDAPAGDSGSAPGLDFRWADQGDPAVLENPVAVAGNGAFTLAVQDRYHYAVEDKWNAVTYTLRNTTAAENTFCLNFLSTAQGKLPHPRGFAREMNRLFLAEELTAGTPYGIILFDFADADLARAVIDTNLLP
jgi:1-phosphatidylinositol phosphodiesterase